MFSESERLISPPSSPLKRWVAPGFFVLSLLLCSCKEKDALLKEQAELEAALRNTRAEQEAYYTKINAVDQGPNVAAVALDLQVKASEKEIKELTQTISELNAKSTRLEEDVKTLRPKFEAYRTKYLR